MDNNHDNGPLIIGAIAAALFLVFLLVDRHYREKSPAVPQATTVSAPEALQADPQVSQPITETQPRPSPGQTVFECIQNGQRIFSDHACGEHTTTRTISPVNIMDAPQPVYRTQPTIGQVEPRYEEREESAPERSCTVYENEVKRVDAVMRQGYTSATGESLRDADGKPPRVGMTATEGTGLGNENGHLPTVHLAVLFKRILPRPGARSRRQPPAIRPIVQCVIAVAVGGPWSISQ